MFELNDKKILGSGQFATVFSGRRDNEPVAIKRIDLSYVGMVEKEVQIQQNLQHERIVALFEFSLDTRFCYLVLELMEGGELFDLIANQNIILDTFIRISILNDIASGINYMHEQEFVHLDIKPENILLNKNLRAKIGDFGSARAMSEGETSQLLGSPSYIPPEIATVFQANREWGEILGTSNYKYDSTVDVYEFGITAFVLVARKDIYPAWVMDHLDTLMEYTIECKHNKIPKGTHPVLADVISGCLNKNPSERMTMKGILDLLATYAEERTLSKNITEPCVETLLVEDQNQLRSAVRELEVIKNNRNSFFNRVDSTTDEFAAVRHNCSMATEEACYSRVSPVP